MSSQFDLFDTPEPETERELERERKPEREPEPEPVRGFTKPAARERPSTSSARTVLSVSDLTANIRSILENAYADV